MQIGRKLQVQNDKKRKRKKDQENWRKTIFSCHLYTWILAGQNRCPLYCGGAAELLPVKVSPTASQSVDCTLKLANNDFLKTWQIR